MDTNSSPDNGTPAPIDSPDQHRGKSSNADDSTANDSSDVVPPVDHAGNLEEANGGEKVDYVPAAIPQEREVQHAKSYFAHKLACATLLVIIIIAIVGGVCGSGHCGGGSETTVAATSAPTSFRSTLAADFEARILEEFGMDYLDEDKEQIGARLQALDWILQEDPLQLESNATNLIQRYIMAIFYFQTSQEGPWNHCDPSGPDLCYYRTWHLESTAPGNAWLTKSHECMWALVECEGFGGGNRSVTSIAIFDNRLHGSLPTELFKLTRLTSLILNGQNLTGAIPIEIARATTLETLILAGNQLEGSIPAGLFEPLENLQVFRLNSNSLTGSIPTTIQFYSGTLLSLANNDLTGTIPTEIYMLSNLQSLYAPGNHLTGSIATDIGKLTGMQFLGLEMTALSGTIPSEIGLLSNCTTIMISSRNLMGTLPEELFTGLPQLEYLHIENCNFSGTISTNIGHMTNLRSLGLAGNEFEGTVPTEISAMADVLYFSINGNKLTGSVPESVCTNSFIGKRFFKGIVADCLPDEGTDIAAMECDCCTECCNRKTGICLEV